MEAPDKIYLTPLMLFAAPQISNSENDVEYVHTDVFIEKALSWLKNHYRDYMYNPTGKRLEAFFGIDMCNDFENYLEG